MDTALIWLLFVGIFTAPLYAAVIGLTWLLLRRSMRSSRALIIAIGSVGFVATFIPLASNIRAERARAALPAEIAPPGWLRLHGDLRISVVDTYHGGLGWNDAGAYGSGTRTCGHFCRTLLAMPDVTSVTVDPASERLHPVPAAGAMTYRRADTGCAPPVDRSREPISFATKAGLYSESSCVAASTPLSHATFRLISIRQEEKERPFIERVEIWDSDDAVLLRSSSPIRTESLTVPLMVEFTFDERDGPFTIARTRAPSSPTWTAWNPGNTLLRFTTVAERNQR